MISNRLAKIRQSIDSVCQKTGRSSSDIHIIGASKYANAQQLQEALEAGLTDIGENRVQDAKEKFDALGLTRNKFTKHMIGHLQTNKAKLAVELFDMIQSVDSLKLAEEIDKQAEKMTREMDVLVEVNTSGEEQKFGLTPSQVPALVAQIAELENIRVLGLMTIAANSDDEKIIRNCFKTLRRLFDQLKEQYHDHPRVSMQFLSMGMTNDYLIAIEEGANMVRIGRAIFQS